MSTPAALGAADLRDRRGHVGGRRVGHRLHGDRRVAADRHGADDRSGATCGARCAGRGDSCSCGMLRGGGRLRRNMPFRPAPCKCAPRGDTHTRCGRRLQAMGSDGRVRDAVRGAGCLAAGAAGASLPSRIWSASSGRSRRTAPSPPSEEVGRTVDQQARCRRHCRWSAAAWPLAGTGQVSPPRITRFSSTGPWRSRTCTQASARARSTMRPAIRRQAPRPVALSGCGRHDRRRRHGGGGRTRRNRRADARCPAARQGGGGGGFGLAAGLISTGRRLRRLDQRLKPLAARCCTTSESGRPLPDIRYQPT